MEQSISETNPTSVLNEILEQNRQSWNAATLAHNSHKGNQVTFFRQGGITLYPEDMDLLGNLVDRDVVHLFCNSGQDTLSLARLGARAVGVDISDEAIAFAKSLSKESSIPADFIRASVLDWLPSMKSGTFDVVFCSYGAIHWVHDLNFFAASVMRILRSGGRFVVIDWHPAARMFDSDWHHSIPYFSDERIVTWRNGVPDYVALTGGQLTPFTYVTGIQAFQNPHPCYSFRWELGEIVTSMAQSGLCIEVLREYPFTRDEHFHHLDVSSVERRAHVPENISNLPLLFGLVATKG